MPTRIPKVSIVVVRKGEQIVPKINEPFDFTKEELADIEALGSDYLVPELDVTGDTGEGAEAGATGKKLTKAQLAAAEKAAKDAEVVGATDGEGSAEGGTENTGGETL